MVGARASAWSSHGKVCDAGRFGELITFPLKPGTFAILPRASRRVTIAFTLIAGEPRVGSMATRDPGLTERTVPITVAEGRARDPVFHTTNWSAVLTARGDDSTAAHAALSDLCQTYWYPLYAYIRRRGNGPPEAEDLTQAFFARLLEKDFMGDLTPGMGRFRSFLLTALKHFLANEWDRSQSQKRGGGKFLLSLDDDEAESRYRVEPVDHTTPETLFEQRWAWTVLEQVLARLRQEFVSSEKAELFEHLKDFLSAANPPADSYADVAARTGLKEGTVAVAVHRLRRRYGELLRAQLAQTVDDPSQVEDELRYLIQVLAK
jgi:RNA polymerase sigma factor (sigma-70 family)